MAATHVDVCSLLWAFNVVKHAVYTRVKRAGVKHMVHNVRQAEKLLQPLKVYLVRNHVCEPSSCEMPGTSIGGITLRDEVGYALWLLRYTPPLSDPKIMRFIRTRWLGLTDFVDPRKVNAALALDAMRRMPRKGN